MGGEYRVRLNGAGVGAMDELRGIVSRHLDDHADYNLTLEFMLRLYRAVDKREIERVVNGLRRELLGPRLSIPGGPV